VGIWNRFLFLDNEFRCIDTNGKWQNVTINPILIDPTMLRNPNELKWHKYGKWRKKVYGHRYDRIEATLIPYQCKLASHKGIEFIKNDEV